MMVMRTVRPITMIIDDRHKLLRTSDVILHINIVLVVMLMLIMVTVRVADAWIHIRICTNEQSICSTDRYLHKKDNVTMKNHIECSQMLLIVIEC